MNVPENEETFAATLLDGGTPATAVDVQQRLDGLGFSHQTISHPPMRTVEDSKKHRDGVPGGYSKNLFLRNKKGKMWLVTLQEDRRVDLRKLGELVGAGRVSFASPERLMKYLGVIPGAVTPLAVINDLSNAVNVVLDTSLLDQTPLHFHPCDNSMTTTIDRTTLMGYLSASGHDPLLVDFDELDSD